MEIRVIATAQQGKDFDYKGWTAVVIDVLRATSVITNALYNGARSIIAVETIEEARQTTYDAATALRGGERNAVRIDGFDLGNSPLEYKREIVTDKDIILTTTNGTLAINHAKQAEKTLVACFRNLQAVADFLDNDNKDLVIVCAGTDGHFSLEDGLCAGMLIHLLKSKRKMECDDLGLLLERDYLTHADNLFGSLVECRHFKHLFELGFYDDLRFCLQTNKTDCIPIFKAGKIVKMKKQP